MLALEGGLTLLILELSLCEEGNDRTEVSSEPTMSSTLGAKSSGLTTVVAYGLVHDGV